MTQQQSRVDILEERVDAQAVSSQEQREDTRSFQAEVNSRFDASDARIESRFNAMDARINTLYLVVFGNIATTILTAVGIIVTVLLTR